MAAPATPKDPEPIAPEREVSGGAVDAELEHLRRLLFGDEWPHVSSLSRRIGTPDGFSEELSRVLSRAIVRASEHDRRLRQSLQPVVEESLLIFARRDPKTLATILFPAIGGAIRKAITASINAVIESLTATIEQSFSARGLEWRLEALRTGKPIGAIVLARSRLFRVEQVFLIHRPSGTLLCQRSAPGARGADPEMVSGMLTAITDFVSDSFGGETEDQELGSIQVDDLRVWIANAPNAFLAAVVRGPAPYEIHNRLRTALEDIHVRLPEALVNFNGDTAPFEGAAPVLETCLLGQAEAPGVKKGRGRWIAAAALVAVLLGVFGWYRYREAVRWRELAGTIEAQPGIVITAANRHWWGPDSIAGLRDPLAADPAALAAKAGYAPSDIQFHWRPFLSLDPPIQAAREIESVTRELATREIHFEVDSTRIPIHQQSDILEIASAIGRLQRAAGIVSRRFVVEVRGEADSTGAAARNATLAAGRAKAVVDALRSQNVPESILRATTAASGGPDASFPRATFRVVEAAR